MCVRVCFAADGGVLFLRLTSTSVFRGLRAQEKKLIVEKLQKPCLCCRLDAGKHRGAGGICFARQRGVKRQFRITKGRLRLSARSSGDDFSPS